MRRNVLVLFALLVPVIGAAQQYVEVRTPAFTVITDGGEARGRDVAERFEQVRGAFGVFFNVKNPTIPEPLTIVAFQDPRNFQQVIPHWVDRTLMPPGLWRPGDDQNVIAIDLNAESRKQSPTIGGIDFGLVRFTKLLMAGNSPPLPAWYDDAFTEYCSSLKITSKQIEYGIPRPDVMKVLQSQPWMKLTQFFGKSPAAPDDIEAQRQTIYYAQAWITIHYLMYAKAGAQLNRLVDLLHQRMDVQDAVRKAFAVEPPAFDNAVRNYFELHMQPFRVNTPADFGKASFQTRPLKLQEWTATLADIGAHSSTEHDDAIQLYQKVLAADPTNSIANRGMGYWSLMRGDFAAAEGYFNKAAASDPGDPRPHYLLGLVANRQRRLMPQAPVQDMKQVIAHLQKATELYPSYADAYHLLSWAEAEQKNPDAARAAIEKAVDLDPRDETLALAMAQLEIQARDYAKARPLLQRLEGSTQPEVAAYAHKALQTLGAEPQQPASVTAREQITAPQWRDPKAEAEAAQAVAREDKPKPAPKPDRIDFMKGEVIGIDCSKSPMVTVTFASKGRTWQMYAPDVRKLLLIGEENFSCSWTNRQASVNFKQTGAGKGEMISLELD